MFKTEKIKQSLLKKGFILEERDHSYFGFYHSGKANGIFTKVSHGSAPPGKDILSKIKRLLHFNSQKFRRQGVMVFKAGWNGFHYEINKPQTFR